MMISGIYKISDTSNVSSKCSDDDLNCILIRIETNHADQSAYCYMFRLCVCAGKKVESVVFYISVVYSL
jgi:hypothetical protein